jgi:precorrin-2 dehydrogenase / sirohydrochlorin ferrochelatase
MTRAKIMAKFLPLFIDLESRPVVIFGGGKVAERKARLFSGYSRVKVISKSFTDGLLSLGQSDTVQLIHSELSEDGEGQYESYLRGAFIAVPATSDLSLNQAIERKAEEMGVLVNKVDGIGDLIVPSIIDRNPVTIAISTLGSSPALSKHIRLKLEESLPEDCSEMARLLRELREEAKIQVSGQEERSRILWSVISDSEVWNLLKDSYDKAYMRAREHMTPR